MALRGCAAHYAETMPESPAAPPQIDVRPEGAAQGGGPWDVAFAVTNRGASDIRLVEAWLPHTILHADAVDLSAHAPLGAQANVILRFTARFEPREPGEPSNPFLILRVLQGDTEWRILARLAVEAGAQGEPATTVVAISAHQVGFSVPPPPPQGED